jgi:hypothetical protein
VAGRVIRTWSSLASSARFCRADFPDWGTSVYLNASDALQAVGLHQQALQVVGLRQQAADN